MASLTPSPKMQFFTANGAPLVGGKLYTYSAGTTTPLATYTDSTGTSANTNPIILDSRGEANVWLGVGLYKMVLKDSVDALIWTVDNISSAATLAASDGSSLIGFIQSGSGAVSRTVQSKLRDVVSINDFLSDAQKADVAAGTAVVDCLSAFNAAKESFPSTLDTTYYRQGGTIEVPPGKYYLSDTFKIDRNIVLRGAGAPYGYCGGISQLVFADNRDGILCVDYRDSPSNKQGSGIVIDGLYLTRKNTSGTVGSGISLKTQARITNVTCTGFRQHGINIDASTSYSPASNANVWEIHSCTLDSNGQHGLYVNGADANAGAAYNVNAINNGGWGIYDSSFLGNTYVACHTASNTLGSYKSDDLNARNVFLGCYSESGQPAASISQPSMIIGGAHASGFGSTDAALGTGGFTYGGLTSNGSFTTGVMTVGNGQSNASGTGLQYLDTNGFYSWTLSKALGRWGYQWANLGTPAFFMWYDRSATPANGYSRDLSTENGAIGIDRHYFGGPSEMKYRGLGTAAPATGTYLQGDIVWNSAPSNAAGQPIGWVCVVGGTPGTWRTFGVTT